MTTTTQPILLTAHEKPKTRRTRKNGEPRKYEHREAMRRIGSRSKIDAIVDRTFKEFDRRNIAIFRWRDYILRNLNSLRDKINEKMEADGTIIKSLVLIHQNQKLKIYITIRVRMVIDSRGELALQLIREFLDHYKAKLDTSDDNIQLMVELLSDLFVQRRKELIVTQGLLNFIRLDIRKIKDVRLKEAHKLLNECISAEESGPIVKLYIRQEKKWEVYQTPEPARRIS